MKTADINVDYIQHVGDDLTVVNAARVSFDKESEWQYTEEFVEPDDYEIIKSLKPGDVKLINYLAKHKHFSPFNHSFITVRVKAPIFVARQLVKHKFMPWNEVSRRYVDDEPEFYIPKFRARAENVKQGSSDEEIDIHYYHGTGGKNGIDDPYADAVLIALEAYQYMLDKGVAPEVARSVLPQNMMTSWWWSGTLGAFCDMLKLRLDPHTQYESRIVAQKIRTIIEPLFPVSVKALLKEIDDQIDSSNS